MLSLSSLGALFFRGGLVGKVITDMDQAVEILDDYLTTYKDLLSQFWQ